MYAWLASTIINHMPWFGKGSRPTVTVKQLLGKKEEVATFVDKESLREHFRKKQAELEKGKEDY